MTRPRNEQEAVNYRKVLDYITHVANQPDFKLSEKIIKKINSISLENIPVYQNVRGRYKTAPNGVGIRLKGCDPKDTARLMAELVADASEWLEEADPDDSDNHPVVIAATVMWKLLQIHPFNEGNGRTSRAVATMILIHHGYLGIPTGDRLHPVRSLEWFFDSDRNYYGECLNKADQGDIDPWLEFFSRAVRATMTLIRNKAAEAPEPKPLE